MEIEETVTNFKEIMNHFFYDWGMSRNGPQINKDPDGSYWINKTVLDEKELTYKMAIYEVSPAAWMDFQFFYENLYKDDSEFELVLGYIENEWNQGNDFIKTNLGYKLGKLSIFENSERFCVEVNSGREYISKDVYSKIEVFIKLLEH